MATAVYVLSALISLACAWLLLRSFVQTRNGLLLWAAICFLGLTLNNALLFVDKVVVPDADLSVWRTLPALAGMLALVVGLLWEEAPVSADFVSGATMAAALVIALIFFRYWRQTRDRLFLMFALGFAVFATSRLILAFLDEDDEGRVFVYGLRLLAFLLILAAIVDKNRGGGGPPAAAERNGKVSAGAVR